MYRKTILNLLLLWIFLFYIVIADEIKCNSRLSEKLTDSTQASVIITLLNNAKNLIDDAKSYATYESSCPSNEPQDERPMDCAEIKEKDVHAKSGVYKIWPRSRIMKGPIDVYCDMDDDGGGWTIIQRRGDFDSGKDYFYKDWNAYKSGFGDLERDHWLGNDNIFAVTNQRSNMVKFTLSDWDGNKTYATFDEFWIEDELRLYTVHVNGYKGTAGDSFSRADGAPFTTKDRDNDSYEKNCAIQFKGAWWYTACHSSNLNGMYLKGPHETHADGVEWHAFRGHYYSLKDSVIKVRPADFKTKEHEATTQ